MSVALDGEPALEREGVRLVYPNPVLLRFRDQDVWEGGVEGHVRRVLQTLHRPSKEIVHIELEQGRSTSIGA